MRHQGVKPHGCHVCGRRFIDKRKLKQHSYLHTGIKPHQCTLCEKGYTTKSMLQRHLLSYSGGHPHRCDLCTKAFLTKTDLNRHMLVHTGEKPHKCTMCEKAFGHKMYLRQHLVTHTEQKGCPCDICNRVFKWKYDLKKHYWLHTVEKPLKCTVCNKGFIRRTFLKKHAKEEGHVQEKAVSVVVPPVQESNPQLLNQVEQSTENLISVKQTMHSQALFQTREEHNTNGSSANVAQNCGDLPLDSEDGSGYDASKRSCDSSKQESTGTEGTSNCVIILKIEEVFTSFSFLEDY